MERKIRYWFDPALSRKCETVTDFSDIRRLSKDLLDTLYSRNAAGLAANQLGDNRRVFVAQVGDFSPRVFVNPEITGAQGAFPYVEACLSFPGAIVPTMGRYSIDVSYADVNGEPHRATFSGTPAVVFQHENDHLEGRNMFNYLLKK
jgi:peptide deformylase